MPGISLTGAWSHIILTSSMAPLYTSVPGNRYKIFGEVLKLKQGQCIQV